MNEIKDKDSILLDQTKKESSNKSVLFLSFIIIFIVGFYFFSNKYISNEKLAEQKIRKMENIVSSINSTINKNQSMLAKMQRKLEEYKDEKDVLVDLVSQPVREQFNINKDYALSEVEHLLTIANHNLLLGHDYETTLSALDAASIRLSGINIKEATVIQEQINKDIDILRSSNQKDLSSFILFLSELSVRIDSFPLKKILMQGNPQNNKKIASEEIRGIENFFTLVLKELKNLVVITRNENLKKDYFLPDEINLLKLSIKFELTNAKFALLNRDKENLSASIYQVKNYLRNYYDLTNLETQNVYNDLSKVTNLEISPPHIDITSSLESVRALIRIQNESGSVKDNKDAINQ